jgi:type IV pilus assembly protein PilZ
MSAAPPTGAVPRTDALPLRIRDVAILQAVWMPWVKGGGLFIPTNKHYRLDDEMLMLITLLDDAERLPVAGKVIWITPPGAQGNRPQGVGVQFHDDAAGRQARVRIEALVAGRAAPPVRVPNTL